MTKVAMETRRRPRRRLLSPIWPRAAMVDAFKAWQGKWRQSEAGVSAVEFALLAPVLVFALVAAVDMGLAEYERMTIDHALRAGAQSAMVDQGQAQVLAVVQNTAAKNFVISTQNTPSTDTLLVSVSQFCACPDSTGTAVSCSTACTGSLPTFVYYSLSGTKIYSGMIMPAVTMSPSVLVQVR